MQRNVGGTDRIARLVLGPVLALVGAVSLSGIALAATDPAGTAVAALAVAVGLVFVATGALRKCPLNAAFGVDTRDLDRSRSGDLH